MRKFILLSFACLSAVCLADTTSTNHQPANHFECIGAGVAVTYSTTSFTGQPLITFTIGKDSFSANGDGIVDRPSELGHLVTITRSAVPDAYTDTLTLLVPDVNLADEASEEFFTWGFATRTYTSIGGPGFVEGPIQNNMSRLLHCEAQLLLF